jgi:hypothetical protein
VLARSEDLLAQVAAAGNHNFESEAHALRGRALMALGRRAEAREALQGALATARGIGQRRAEWPALSWLAQLEETAGDQPAALAWRQAAQALAVALAATLPASLRPGMLSLTQA